MGAARRFTTVAGASPEPLVGLLPLGDPSLAHGLLGIARLLPWTPMHMRP